MSYVSVSLPPSIGMALLVLTKWPSEKREIIDSLLARSRASYVMVWGTPEMAKVTMPVPPLQSWLKEARK